jgi:hypothetical protein
VLPAIDWHRDQSLPTVITSSAGLRPDRQRLSCARTQVKFGEFDLRCSIAFVTRRPQPFRSDGLPRRTSASASSRLSAPQQSGIDRSPVEFCFRQIAIAAERWKTASEERTPWRDDAERGMLFVVDDRPHRRLTATDRGITCAAG